MRRSHPPTLLKQRDGRDGRGGSDGREGRVGVIRRWEAVLVSPRMACAPQSTVRTDVGLQGSTAGGRRSAPLAQEGLQPAECVVVAKHCSEGWQKRSGWRGEAPQRAPAGAAGQTGSVARHAQHAHLTRPAGVAGTKPRNGAPAGAMHSHVWHERAAAGHLGLRFCACACGGSAAAAPPRPALAPLPALTWYTFCSRLLTDRKVSLTAGARSRRLPPGSAQAVVRASQQHVGSQNRQLYVGPCAGATHPGAAWAQGSARWRGGRG